MPNYQAAEALCYASYDYNATRDVCESYNCAVAVPNTKLLSSGIIWRHAWARRRGRTGTAVSDATSDATSDALSHRVATEPFWPPVRPGGKPQRLA